MNKEIWKDIAGYVGSYQVSNWGNVKSFKLGKERILKPCVDAYGYLHINLYKDNKGKTYKIHKLVAIAFLGHLPDGYNMVVNHIDNNPLNNNLDNLELITQAMNTRTHKTDPGIHYDKKRDIWYTQIYIGKNIHLGYFTNKQDAIDMNQKAIANIHLYNGDAKEFRNKLIIKNPQEEIKGETPYGS